VIRNEKTGEGIEGAHIKLKNLTSGRNHEIDHDILSGIVAVSGHS
jgi:hypothetical protein